MSLHLRALVPERDVDVDLVVPSGQTLALLGPNGAGKSTLLAVAAGLLDAREGHVSLAGRTLTETVGGRRRTAVPPHDRSVGLLAQEPLLFPHLSVLDNVAFGPRSRGEGRTPARRRAHEWLDRVDLAALADRRPAQLSGGQAQRVAVARALAADPALVLLDEPLAALDVDVTPALRQTLSSVLAERTTVIATHDVLDAVLLSDAVAVIDGGRVVEHGPTRDVLTRPRSAFGARIAGLNLVTGAWRDGAVRTPQGDLVRGHLVDAHLRDGTAAVAIFRPAAVAVHLDDSPGSPRNIFEVTVESLEPHGDLVRVRGRVRQSDQQDPTTHAGGTPAAIHADITPAAVAELRLVPGVRARFVVKAAEVDVYAAAD